MDSQGSGTEKNVPAAGARFGSVAVLGAPNAGKSALINTLVGGKVSIVSPRVQTTRTLVRGIFTKGASQVVLVDTPGIFMPGKRLERAMIAAAWEGEEGADIAALVVDAARGRVGAETQSIIKKLSASGRPAVLILNKADKAQKEDLLKMAAALNAAMAFEATFMVSATMRDGTQDVAEWLAAHVPEGAWMFPEDEIGDMPLRLLAAEITREKLFRALHHELPHALTVETESWETFEDGSARIGQVIYVQRDSQKAIVLGRAGSQIGEVGEAARRELEGILGARVHLKLFVKVEEGWQDDPERYAPWGLDSSA